MAVQNILTHHLIPREDFWLNGFWPVIESATALGFLNPPNFDATPQTDEVREDRFIVSLTCTANTLMRTRYC